MVLSLIISITLAAAAHAQQQPDAAKSIEAVMASRYIGFAKGLAACDAELARQSTFTQQAQARVKELKAELAEFKKEDTGNESRD